MRGGGGGGVSNNLKNTIEAMKLFRETYGDPSKYYIWKNGDLIEYKYSNHWSQIPEILRLSSSYDYSIFNLMGNSISGLFIKIKNLFKKPNFNNFKSTDEKYKMTQQEIHDYLINDQGLSVQEADQVCNDCMNIVSNN